MRQVHNLHECAFKPAQAGFLATLKLRFQTASASGGLGVTKKPVSQAGSLSTVSMQPLISIARARAVHGISFNPLGTTIPSGHGVPFIWSTIMKMKLSRKHFDGLLEERNDRLFIHGRYPLNGMSFKSGKHTKSDLLATNVSTADVEGLVMQHGDVGILIAGRDGKFRQYESPYWRE